VKGKDINKIVLKVDANNKEHIDPGNI